jgi:excisionase family DNA binding protein
VASTALTVEQVAEKLNVSQRTIRRMIASKTIKAFRVGQRTWRIDQADLDAYIEDQKQKAAAS